MKQAVKMIGIGESGRADLLPLYEKMIAESDVLVGGERQLACFPDYQGEKVIIKSGVMKLAERLEKEDKRIVVLASGDPLFYGIGGFLANKLNLEIYPYISSIQLAFARVKESWHDAYFTSIHGRSMKGLAQRIDGRQKVAVLTDSKNSPQRLATYLKAFDMTEYKAFVAENLGGEAERTGWYSLDEMESTDFSPLNIVILKKTGKAPVWSSGIEDEEFSQRKPDKGLITKKEIRNLCIGELGIQIDSIVWDIGTCTGSVAIEAAKLAKEGAVYAIEKNEKDIENCLENMKKFRADLTVIHGKAPEGLTDFPDPDAIFIGGTAGGMEEILEVCCRRLKPDGRIVLNVVTVESLSAAMEALKKNGFQVSVTLAQISRSKPILKLTRFEALNPVYIIAARRKEKQ
ncbi:bifunctional cobalt-precorrin-7 (C(5))-methyltransferase/cobalt-precorrin-6B (C(15))-methyltransferase [Bacillus massilinigeriensis]|uniref:bifunctional cobalt-precorrin-7 (C(5))-methyltransferase/cobalt-precorrin-6B (C(15))-methyltransferase n=1 Tax=Bacillus mediterraneensis TaxID=1805474 RepID=UPI0008F93331|nr:bifunctional cobalt-precorrin-7 (C(5))-methyltransferase/cobalt-precorrin-6B (C(15))-methyltransferase [Bacillus mediterraneensis]